MVKNVLFAENESLAILLVTTVLYSIPLTDYR